jgi:hypothetical protein
VADGGAEHLPKLAERRGLDAPLVLAALSVMPVEWPALEDHESVRADAERRMGAIRTTGRRSRSR